MGKLSEAVKQTQEHGLNEYTEQGLEVFIALYGVLGMDELYDGIASAMQDEGYDEVYEDIMFYYEDEDSEAELDGSHRVRE